MPAIRSALGLVLLSGLDDERRHQHLVTHAGLDEEAVAALDKKISTAGHSYVAHEADMHERVLPLLLETAGKLRLSWPSPGGGGVPG